MVMIDSDPVSSQLEVYSEMSINKLQKKLISFPRLKVFINPILQEKIYLEEIHSAIEKVLGFINPNLQAENALDTNLGNEYATKMICLLDTPSHMFSFKYSTHTLNYEVLAQLLNRVKLAAAPQRILNRVKFFRRRRFLLTLIGLLESDDETIIEAMRRSHVRRDSKLSEAWMDYSMEVEKDNHTPAAVTIESSKSVLELELWISAIDCGITEESYIRLEKLESTVDLIKKAVGIMLPAETIHQSSVRLGVFSEEGERLVTLLDDIKFDMTSAGRHHFWYEEDNETWTRERIESLIAILDREMWVDAILDDVYA